MIEKEPNVGLDKLPPELLSLILLFVSDPRYLVRLKQVNKALRKIIEQNQVDKAFWSETYKRHFANSFSKISHPHDIDYKNEYVKAYDKRNKTCNLEEKHKKLFNWIRWDDLSSIQRQTYALGSFWNKKNDFIDVIDKNNQYALALASIYGRNQILAHFYKEMDEFFLYEERDYMDRSKLYWAVTCNRPSEVSDLLKQGWEVNQTINNDITPLLAAANWGRQELVTLFLSAGANVNQATKEGETPLYFAVYRGHLDIVTTLLDAKASIDQTENKRETLLCVAAGYGYLNIVIALLGAGAPVDEAKYNGVTPLFIASQEGHLNIVHVLLRASANVNQARDMGATPLFVAAQNGHLNIVTVLLNAGANVNQASNHGSTPLYIAAQNGHLNIVTVLLSAGANINRACDSGVTPLHIATQSRNKDIVAGLLKAGANIAPTNKGVTPLHIAARVGELEIVTKLLKAGANVNQATNHGATPLYVVAKVGPPMEIEIVIELLKAGADITQATNTGSTPLSMAKEKGHEKVYASIILWEKNILQKELSLTERIIGILETIIIIPSYTYYITGRFFSNNSEKNLITELKKSSTIDKEYLKKLIESKKDSISAVKYDFIMIVLLNGATDIKVDNHLDSLKLTN